MNRVSRICGIVLALMVSVQPLAALAEGASFGAGLSAYNAGDYERAAELWAPLAAEGDANAQSGLGLLYYSGFGVRRDFDLARTLFVQAAERGVVQSQMFLSLMYFRGDGVRRDYRLAYMWCDNAVAEGYDQAIDFRALVAHHMSPEDVMEASRLASGWRAQNARH